LSRSPLNPILLVIAIALLVLSLATLVPHTSSMVNVLGYESLCPFAPWSTLALLFGSGVAWAVRQHIDTQIS
jgi:hypothetical protein